MDFNHSIWKQPLANRGYESFAPFTILDRVLEQYSDIGLSDEIIRKLLDIKREYKEFLMQQWAKLINNWTELDVSISNIEINIEECKSLIKQRAIMMQELDEYFLDTVLKIKGILDKNHLKILSDIYNFEKQSYFQNISEPLRHKFKGIIEL